MNLLLERSCGRDEFILLFVKLLQERLPLATMKMAGDSVIEINDAGRESTVYMENTWITYRDDPENRAETLRRFIHMVTLDREHPVPKREGIVATIKDAQFLSLFNGDTRPVSEHLCGDLWIVYAQDLPEKISTLTSEQLNSSGIAQNDLRGLSRANLRNLLPPAERHGNGPWYMLTAGGDYTASLLILEDLWDELAGTVDGDIVAVAPSRDVIFFTGSSSKEGLQALREQASKILSSGNHLISETLVLRRGDKWEVFEHN